MSTKRTILTTPSRRSLAPRIECVRLSGVLALCHRCGHPTALAHIPHGERRAYCPACCPACATPGALLNGGGNAV